MKKRTNKYAIELQRTGKKLFLSYFIKGAVGTTETVDKYTKTMQKREAKDIVKKINAEGYYKAKIKNILNK